MRGLLTVGLLGACFAPHPPEGAPCSSSHECPAPLRCELDRCVSPGSGDAGIDGRSPIDANPGCQCTSDTTIACDGGSPIACSLGCVSEAAGARCRVLAPSNGVPWDPSGLGPAVSIAGATTFDTDTGAISGGLTRTAGEGVIAGIRFTRVVAPVPLGVFTFPQLAIAPAGTVRFSGAAAAVFVVATTATIAGTIDGSGGCYGADRRCAGPGGGTGGTFAVPATGCGFGGAGQSEMSAAGTDGGGGGGGGALAGGKGGDAAMTPGGVGGVACLAASLEPLVGGGGGGGAGARSATLPPGGGGGGALQLSVGEQLSITGTITMGGEGGGGGVPDPSNASGGSGGGAGGAILLEAPTVMIVGNAHLAANGGGGGGGGQLGTAGQPGMHAFTTSTSAPGGSPALQGGAGGAGGAGSVAAGAGGAAISPYNGGGGGGAVGRIFVRAAQLTSTASVSPAAGTGPVRSQ